jgi:hypothetical protein
VFWGKTSRFTADDGIDRDRCAGIDPRSKFVYDSEQTVGPVHTFTVVLKDPGTYFFAVLVIDNNGASSWYSREVQRVVSQPGPGTITTIQVNCGVIRCASH